MALFQVPNLKKYDVAILGGGVSGLYCAMKLLENSEMLAEKSVENIIILEKSENWGGRLDSDIINVHDREVTGHIKEEEGAMRFTYHEDPASTPKSNMPLLSELIKELGMGDEIEPFYMEPQKDPVTPEFSTKSNVPNCNACHFQGDCFTQWYATQNPELWTKMFNLKGVQEKFKSADDIVVDVYLKLLELNASKIRLNFPDIAETILAQRDKNLLQEYEGSEYWSFFRNEFTWRVGMQDIPLNEFSMEALLTTMGYSHGCIRMMKSTQGFLQDVISGGNAGSILQDLLTFNLIWDRLYQFKKGWSHLVEKLVKLLKKQSGANGVEVEMINRCGVERISTSEDGFDLGLKDDTVSAKRVVLALPPKAVENIFMELENTGDRDILFRICRSVVGFQMTKINLYFKDDWWNKVKGVRMFGPNITSLPCASIYPFYSDCKKRGCEVCDKCINDQCPAALTIYCDVNNSEFWSGLQSLGHKFQSPLQECHPDILPASESVVHEALKELKEVFNVDGYITRPILTSYRCWGGEDNIANFDASRGQQNTNFGYAVHMWRIGVDDYKIRKKVAKPLQDKKLYMCNEAWSEYQSWVEGSLLSTQTAVDQLLKDL